MFAFTLYRIWTFPVLAIAAVAVRGGARGSTTGSLYYADASLEVQLVRGALMAISAAIIAAGGSILLVRALRRTGVLEGFPADA